MNWMALLVTFFGVTAIITIREQDKRIQAHRRYIRHLRRLIDEYVEAADLMNNCNVDLERRNVWLEQRRHVILRRWWRRAERTHRRLATWQVRKGPAA